MKNFFAVCTISINDETAVGFGIETGKILRLSKKTGLRGVLFFSYSLISVLYCLLALIHTVQERDDLCSGTAAVRAKQAAADTVGNAIVNRPLDRTCVICVHVYVSEIAVARSGICPGCARQDRYAMCARAGLIRAEGGIGRTVCDAVLNCPCNCLGVVCICRNIREAAQRLRFRRTRRAPQEGYNLRSGAGSVRANSVSLIPPVMPLLRRPEDCVIIIILRVHIGEEVEHGVVIHKGCLHRNLARRHDEGVLAAALVGQRERLAVLVQHGQAFEGVALVGGLP